MWAFPSDYQVYRRGGPDIPEAAPGLSRTRLPDKAALKALLNLSGPIADKTSGSTAKGKRRESGGRKATGLKPTGHDSRVAGVEQ